jgi:hypothetical protein
MVWLFIVYNTFQGHAISLIVHFLTWLTEFHALHPENGMGRCAKACY